MRVAIGIVAAVVIGLGAAGFGAWQQTERELRAVRASNTELRTYAAELGERLGELAGGGQAARSGEEIAWDRLDRYIWATAEYAACRRADDLKTMLRPSVGWVGGCSAPRFRLPAWMDRR